MYKLYRDLGRCRLVCGNPREDKDFAVYTFNANGWLVGWRRRGMTYSCGLDGRAQRTRFAEAWGRRFLRTVSLSASELMRNARGPEKFWRPGAVPQITPN